MSLKVLINMAPCSSMASSIACMTQLIGAKKEKKKFVYILAWLAPFLVGVTTITNRTEAKQIPQGCSAEISVP